MVHLVKGVLNRFIWPRGYSIHHWLNFDKLWPIFDLGFARGHIRFSDSRLCIKICWALEDVLQSNPAWQGFQQPPTAPRGLADINVSEKHFLESRKKFLKLFFYFIR